MRNIIFDHSEAVANNTRTFWFQSDVKLDYVAGQFIELFLPHNNPDGRGQKHWFTLSSSPSEEHISITTKQATGRSSTFKDTLFNLPPGTAVNISEPMGDFVLPKDKSIPLVFVAGGIGITPVRSMVKWLSDTHERRDVHIIYGARESGDIAFRELFDDYGAKPNVILTKQSVDQTMPARQLSADIIFGHAVINPKTQIYVSGPELMVEKLELELKDAGISPDRLVLDFFPGYPIN